MNLKSEHLFDFWVNEKEWPLDKPNHVFLPRAINAVGQALFEDAWEGVKDIIAHRPQNLPSYERASVLDHKETYRLLRRRHPELGLLPDWRRLTVTEWQLAIETVAEEDAESRPAVHRYNEVERALVMAAQAGAIVTCHRPVRGGEMVEMPSHWWDTERTQFRFAMCQINPDNIFGIGVGGAGYSYIFVTKDTLTPLCEMLAEKMRGSNVSPPAAETAPSIVEPDGTTHHKIVPQKGPKAQNVYRGMLHVWKDGWVPKILSANDIQKQIDPIVKTSDPGGAGPDTIRRILGLKGRAKS